MLGLKIIATGLSMMVVTVVIHALFMVGGAIRAMGSRERLTGGIRTFGSIPGAHVGLRTRERSGRGADALGDILPIHHLAVNVYIFFR